MFVIFVCQFLYPLSQRVNERRETEKNVLLFEALHCNKTCKREQLNRLILIFLHEKCSLNNFFHQFHFVISLEGWETGKDPIIFIPLENLKTIIDFLNFKSITFL